MIRDGFARGCGRALAAAAALGLALAALAVAAASPAAAGGLSYTQNAPVGGIVLPGSPYRWQTYVLDHRHRATVVERIDRRGGLVSRRWTIRGNWHLSAPAYDLEGAGLAGDESVLVLERYDPIPRRGLRRRTHLAILDTGPHRLHGPNPFRRVTLPGDYAVYGISPDGETVFLAHNLSFAPEPGPRFTIASYSLRMHRLLPAQAVRGEKAGRPFSATAVSRTQDPSGHHVYILYMNQFGTRGAGDRVFLLALDTIGGALTRVEVPALRGEKNPLLLDLHLDASGHTLTIRKRSSRHWVKREPVAARIDLRRLRWPATASASHDPVGVFGHTVGHSRGGRPIELLDVGDLSLPGRLLVFGCIHGDECGASALEPLGEGGCPDGYGHAYVVPNLDPDGSARRSRLNGNGVDLNRNFAAAWRGGGAPGDPEYPGARPFSEPETRLTARLIRRLRPAVTIWFHQHWGDGRYVRAWGASVPAARRFARLSGLGFRAMPWEAGTAPNWQNHHFPGTASFVVELPRGRLPQQLRTRLDRALGRFGEKLGEDPSVVRKR